MILVSTIPVIWGTCSK